MSTVLVTGGAGFIGSTLIRHLIASTDHHVVNADKLTYAGNLESLESVASNPRYSLEEVDICDRTALDSIFAQHQPHAVFHLAAESHVDRSIDAPAPFIKTNIEGTYSLLEATRSYWNKLDATAQRSFRFLHVSTDEVFGSLDLNGYFTEDSPYSPRSPYSASKAAADHLVRAWHHTYGLPVIVTNCSNNYGPYQFPEKLIPVVILKALRGEPIPVYGKGENIRDWLYVEDHADALYRVLCHGRIGETYAIGGNNERRNIDLVSDLCRLMDELNPAPKAKRHEDLITFVSDRPGHDFRYALDSSKIRGELSWKPRERGETGLRKTVQWYLEHHEWWTRILDGSYRLERLGVAGKKAESCPVK